MLVMTSERCPNCDSIIYMVIYPKKSKVDNEDVMKNILVYDVNGIEHIMGDGCYLSKDGEMTVTMFDEDTWMPEYYCIFCRWTS